MKRSEIVKTINGLEGEAGHNKVVEIYNNQKNLPRGYKLQKKDPWCAATVTAVFLLNGCDTFAECSCPVMIKKAKDAGLWVEADSYQGQPGDVIMYDWQDSGLGDDSGTADHTGIVIKNDGKWLTVREGNKNKTLGNRKVQVDSRYISGFITPIFEQEEEDVKMPTIKNGSTGKAVAVWQIIAGAYPDGEFKSETLKATKVFQEEHGLTVDGIVGDKTWSEGLKTL